MSDAAKRAALHESLAALPGAIVAFSGGVDSTMLLHACHLALGGRVVAITADSASLPRQELAEARELAARIGVRHEVLPTGELARDEYRRNDADRCFHCKDELFRRIAAWQRGRPEAAWPVLYGAIADDLADHRPGARAAAQHRALAPLATGGWSKADVRRYSRDHGLPTADKPAMACLASRVPYGTEVGPELLGRIERAEAALRALGFRELRVRHHGDVARLEVGEADLVHAVAERARILAAVRAAGWPYVALDLAGYRRGAMNEVLPSS
jgi:uncharacterized protein